MSEQQEPYTTAQEPPIDPHTALYQQLRQGFSQNSMLYEYLSSDMVKMLPDARPQAIEDALHQMCVSLSKTPLESLIIIHEFLRNYHSIMQHEKEPEPVEQGPFFGRSE